MTAHRPNLFIPGAPKAGTTALARFLSEHPDIYITTPKEPGYWARDLPAALRRRYGTDSWDDYVSLFDNGRARASRFRGEATTHYLMSEVAIERIIAYEPGAVFVVLLRNPVDLAHAFHGQLLFGRYEQVADFEAAWRLQPARAEGRDIPATCRAPRFLQYGDVAALGSQLERMLAHVPRPQVYIGFFDDLRADPRAVYRAVLEFLGLADDGRTDFPTVNPAKTQRFPRLADLLHAPPRPLEPAVHTLRRVFRTGVVGSGNVVSRLMTRPEPRAGMRPAFRDELVEYFDPEITRLEAITGRDLDHWRR